jgi:hypothetical protein
MIIPLIKVLQQNQQDHRLVNEPRPRMASPSAPPPAHPNNLSMDSYRERILKAKPGLSFSNALNPILSEIYLVYFSLPLA